MKVIAIKGPGKGRSFDLNVDSVTISRSYENDIQINDRSVSRNHAKIKRRETFILLKI